MGVFKHGAIKHTGHMNIGGIWTPPKSDNCPWLPVKYINILRYKKINTLSKLTEHIGASKCMGGTQIYGSV